MKTKKIAYLIVCFWGMVSSFSSPADAGSEVIKLIEPGKTGGRPFMEVLASRQSNRDFAKDAVLTNQQVSNLLYSAYGINRPDGRKTVPAARKLYDLEIYLVDSKGAWLYNPATHQLSLINGGDYRAECGPQEFHKNAAVELVYVSDLDKLATVPEADRIKYAMTHAGFSIQNVYLCAANEGLSTVVCGMVSRDRLSDILKLKGNKVVLYAQPIGVPKVEKTGDDSILK